MSFACFVLHIPHKQFFVCESCSQCFGTGNESAAIVSDIDDKSVAGCEIGKNLIKISRSEAVFKAGTTQISDVVIKNAVLQSVGLPVIGADVFIK